MEEKDVLVVAGQFAYLMLTSGAETGRVESSIDYVGRALGVPIICHVTMTSILLVNQDSGRSFVVKVPRYQVDLQMVHDLNHLSRQLFQGQVDFETFRLEVERLSQGVPHFPLWQQYMGAGFVSMAPNLVELAPLSDFLLTFFLGIFAHFLNREASRLMVPPYLAVGVSAFVVALLTNSFYHLGWGQTFEVLLISSLMPLVPGVALTNSLRELLGGHTISGLVRAVNALLIAASIGGGVMMANLLFKALI